LQSNSAQFTSHFAMKLEAEHGPPKRWYPTIKLHGVSTQKTSTWTSKLSVTRPVLCADRSSYTHASEVLTLISGNTGIDSSRTWEFWCDGEIWCY